MNATGQHPFALPYPIVENRLVVGGIPITRLAERVGQTPFYAYDRRHTKEYHRLASEGDEAFQAYLQTYIYGCDSQAQYLETIGGMDSLERLASWQQGAEVWQALYA